MEDNGLEGGKANIKASSSRRPVFRLALTGGPCAGKTSALNRITDRLELEGFQVVRVPETATIVLGGGLSPQRLSQGRQTAWQTHFIRTMIMLEDNFVQLAAVEHEDELRASSPHPPPPLVLICDRGTMARTHLS